MSTRYLEFSNSDSDRLAGAILQLCEAPEEEDEDDEEEDVEDDDEDDDDESDDDDDSGYSE
jgi:hypothetical protein